MVAKIRKTTFCLGLYKVHYYSMGWELGGRSRFWTAVTAQDLSIIREKVLSMGGGVGFALRDENF
jgi:hypothetical protein